MPELVHPDEYSVHRLHDERGTVGWVWGEWELSAPAHAVSGSAFTSSEAPVRRSVTAGGRIEDNAS